MKLTSVTGAPDPNAVTGRQRAGVRAPQGFDPEPRGVRGLDLRVGDGPEPFALSVLVLSGLVRVVTNARIFTPPSALDEVFGFIAELAHRPTARIVGPGPDHMAIFERLCRDAGATGKLVADAQHAAVAIEHGCTMVSTDSDFDRFPGLRWQHPLRP
ncbi:MAG: PIN domain-containing protein [Acidobacteria bacterium]|nr:PIN domain-containing protein [Acidobacteriota bacterium]